jgi:pimeloyl-ACP methyl ester carboxylesterase
MHSPEKQGAGVMVLNGWAASSHAWDLCGFMKKEPAPLLYSYVDQLDGKPESAFEAGGRFVVVGWSMGGSSALRLACRYSGQIAGLVLVAATPRMMEELETGWQGMTPRRLEALRKGLELTQGQGFFGAPEDRPNPYMMDAPENLERGLKYLVETDVRAVAARTFADGCAFPVHIFQSERDGIVRSSNAEWLKGMFPSARLTFVGGAEHALPVSIPDLIDEAVCEMAGTDRARHSAEAC